MSATESKPDPVEAKALNEGPTFAAAPSAEPATEPQPAWKTHPDGPFAGIVAWAEGEFSRLETLINKSGGVAGVVKEVESDISDKLAPSSSSMGTSVTQPSMSPTPNLGGTKE